MCTESDWGEIWKRSHNHSHLIIILSCYHYPYNFHYILLYKITITKEVKFNFHQTSIKHNLILPSCCSMLIVVSLKCTVEQKYALLGCAGFVDLYKKNYERLTLIKTIRSTNRIFQEETESTIKMKKTNYTTEVNYYISALSRDLYHEAIKWFWKHSNRNK